MGLPDNEYVVYRHAGFFSTLHWELLGDGPFDYAIRGIRGARLGFIPSPFGSRLQPAESKYHHVDGRFGKRGFERYLTICVVVKVAKPKTIVRFSVIQPDDLVIIPQGESQPS